MRVPFGICGSHVKRICKIHVYRIQERTSECEYECEYTQVPNGPLSFVLYPVKVEGKEGRPQLNLINPQKSGQLHISLPSFRLGFVFHRLPFPFPYRFPFPIPLQLMSFSFIGLWTVLFVCLPFNWTPRSLEWSIKLFPIHKAIGSSWAIKQGDKLLCCPCHWMQLEVGVGTGP